jgi:hypothetical protein
VIRSPAELASEPIGRGGEGVLVVGVCGHDQKFLPRGFGGDSRGERGSRQREQET